MRKFLYYSCILLMFGCSKKTHKKHFQDYYEVFELNKLGNKEGLVKYFDNKNILFKELFYENGVKNGKEIKYALTGEKISENFYHKGLKNGYQFTFDKNGDTTSKINYYYGKEFGAAYYYTNGEVSDYYFYDFAAKDIIYAANYNNTEISKIMRSPIKVQAGSLYVNDTLKTKLFVYLIRPPLIEMDYYLGIYDTITKKQNVLGNLQTDDVYIDTILPSLQNSQKYFVKVNYIDRKKNINKVYMEVLY